jgi:hypothetical protein
MTVEMPMENDNGDEEEDLPAEMPGNSKRKGQGGLTLPNIGVCFYIFHV